jgi:hypothetical protein
MEEEHERPMADGGQGNVDDDAIITSSSIIHHYPSIFFLIHFLDSRP